MIWKMKYPLRIVYMTITEDIFITYTQHTINLYFSLAAIDSVYMYYQLIVVDLVGEEI